MLQLQKVFLNRPILSLRTGAAVGTALRPIINPNNLKIEGFYAQDRFQKGQVILLAQDIRDSLPQGFVVDDHDVLTSPDELVRLKDVLELDFNLMDKPVVTAKKKRLGKINDYAVESETLYIQKLYVSQSLLKSFTGGQLSIDRDQVIEITNRRIVVKDPLQPKKAQATATAPAVS
jgi:uncharacterized protein YrrD